LKDCELKERVSKYHLELRKDVVIGDVVHCKHDGSPASDGLHAFKVELVGRADRSEAVTF